MELQLPGMRRRPRGPRRAAHPVLDRHPLGRRSLVPGQRLARPAAATRRAALRPLRRHAGRADRRRRPHRRGDRPHRRPPPPARVLDPAARLLDPCGARRADHEVPAAEHAGDVLRRRLAAALRRRADAAGGHDPGGRDLPDRRRRAPLHGRRARARGDRPHRPRLRHRRHPGLRPRDRGARRGRHARGSTRATWSSPTAPSSATTTSSRSASASAIRGRWATRR